ncbi:hypothetical protein OSTOST_19891 [Ostertagia ostertagi]
MGAILSREMAALRVTLWVTLWGVLIHHAEALNSTLSSTSAELTLDHAIERSVQLEHLEGSGIDIVTDSSSTLTSLAHIDPTAVSNKIRKRAADFYNGFVGPQFYSPFSISAPRFPPTAVIGLSRPLQRDSMPPHVEYVALCTLKIVLCLRFGVFIFSIWILIPIHIDEFSMNPRNAAPHWGSIYLDPRLHIEGTFIQDGRIKNLTQPDMAKETVRLLQYVGTPESNNFKFVWVLARNLDVATALSYKAQSNICSPRLAPAVFQDDGYEFLGEADIDNRMMQYVFQGHVHVVDKGQFLSKVYVLTKQRCSCSCAGANVQRDIVHVIEFLQVVHIVSMATLFDKFL